ncbi:MAG: DUF1801 domain-containing protein [Flavobacteriaceae bacterium]|nr:DUF1801 domain-containing protein [Flavobacteriaceae bacterium]
MKPIDQYFLDQRAPYQSILLYIRSVILRTLPEVIERYSHNVPFYNIEKKPMLYLNILKGKNYVDVAFVHGVVFEKAFPMLKNNNKRKQVRSIKVKSLEDFNELQFVELLKVAAIQTQKNKQAWYIDGN